MYNRFGDSAWYFHNGLIWKKLVPAAGTGTVTNVSVVTANGVSAAVANPTSTPALTFTLGAITPSSVAATGSVTGANLSGTNTGDQTITLTGPVTGSGTGSFATTITPTAVTAGSYTSANVTVGADGRITAASNGSSGGTVTSVSVTSANGVSGTVATATTTPAITLSLGAITPTSVNSVVLVGASTPSLTVTGTTSVSGTNTGDQTITLTGDVTGSGTGSFATTLVTANATPGTYAYATVTVDGKGRVTTASSGSAPSGTVTSVNVVPAHGFSGTVANPTTTPSITLTTTVNAPAVAGDGTSLIPATTTGSGSTVALSTSPVFTNPTVGTQAVTDNSTLGASTAYVTTAIANAVAGVNPAVAVQVATTANVVNLSYSNGASGIGATLTQTVAAVVVIDGYTPVLNDRILFKDQTVALRNGIYQITTLGTGVIFAVFTRASDYNQPGDINNTGPIPVINGTDNPGNKGSSWIITSTVTAVGTDALTYARFSYEPSALVLSVSGTANQIASTGGQNPVLSLVSGGTLSGAWNLGTPASLTLTNATGLSLVTGITGILPTANGGTGLGTLTAHNLLVGNGTGNMLFLAPSTAGNLNLSNGTDWLSVAMSGDLTINSSGATTIKSSVALAGSPTVSGTASTAAGGIVTIDGTQTLTNKRTTARVSSTTTVSATPAFNTDNYDIFKVTAQTANITSMTTNLTGTPGDGDIVEFQITAGSGTPTFAAGTSFANSSVSQPTALSTTTITIVYQWFTVSSYGNNKWICVNSF